MEGFHEVKTGDHGEVMVEEFHEVKEGDHDEVMVEGFHEVKTGDHDEVMVEGFHEMKTGDHDEVMVEGFHERPEKTSPNGKNLPNVHELRLQCRILRIIILSINQTPAKCKRIL